MRNDEFAAVRELVTSTRGIFCKFLFKAKNDKSILRRKASQKIAFYFAFTVIDAAVI